MRNVYSTMRRTSMPSTRAASLFCATACIARPVSVRVTKSCSRMTMSAAMASVPTSAYDTFTPATANWPAGKGLPNWCASAL
jgi:hypothetical protein